MSNSIANEKIAEVLRDNKKSLDEIQQHLYDVIVINQLTNAEVATLFTSLMRQVLSTSHNATLLNNLGLDASKLNPEAVAEIQKVLTVEWLSVNGLLEK